MPEQAARHALEKLCNVAAPKVVEAKTFPLAEENAVILRCRLPGANGPKNLAVLLSNGPVVAAESSGYPDAKAGPPSGPGAVPYAGYKVEPQTGQVSDPARRRVWISSPENLHSHAFLTSLVDWPGHRSSKQDTDLILFRPGLAESELKALLQDTCERLTRKTIDPARFGMLFHSVEQLDCLGARVSGIQPKLESVLGDVHLWLTWVLLAKHELDRVQKDLSSAFGAPDHVSGSLIRFGDGPVYLRLDVPEILIADQGTAEQIAAR